jgi:hypothetical protein
VLCVALLNIGFDLGTLSLMVGAFAPAIVLIAAVNFEKIKRARTVKAPQEEKLLRPPGYSLALQIDTLTDRSATQLIWAMFWTGLAGVFAGYIARVFTQPVTLSWILTSVAILTLTVVAGTHSAIRAYRTLQQRRNVRLGLRGEQATAEALHEAADAGLRVFHDIQAGDDWNIDHVAIGTKGVFIMETKARSRLPSKSDQPAHHVKFDGATLEFPGGFDQNAAAQARRNAGWLSNYLVKKTGESVPIEAIVVLPGWWVEGRGESVKAMNCKYLTKYLRSQNDKLDADQVARITSVLDEKNRTLDFI